ncbi:hypothetical protein CSKR_104476 [Clonorchis sinensis]|uniref:Uncharacterized protein n=1 Tax=Clonorchis sinensis TaxID=79923 RepID=A0A419PWD5_CLOSI|nr:hypothetical protein CSKR_104476 [Clonorchis sinensis]
MKPDRGHPCMVLLDVVNSGENLPQTPTHQREKAYNKFVIHQRFQSICKLSVSLLVPNCHATRRLHGGWDTARLPKPSQGKSRGRGRFRTMGLPGNTACVTLYGGMKTSVGLRKRKVRVSSPTSASRLLLSRLRQPGSIPALMPLSVGMEAR